jgi:hypothetical protein
MDASSSGNLQHGISLFEGRFTRTIGLGHYPALGRSPVFDGVGSEDSILENGVSISENEFVRPKTSVEI